MNVSPVGGGQILSAYFGLREPIASYPATFNNNRTYKMTAEPDTRDGYIFKSWTVLTDSASYTYTTNPLTVTLYSDTEVTAHFILPDTFNYPPNASAGEDQSVLGGQLVTLNGSGSNDPDDGIKSYFWQQTAGTSVTLSNTSAIQPTFMAPTSTNETLTFNLTVKDYAGQADIDTVNITVGDYNNYTNQPPIANAGGDQTVDEGDLVTLDGSHSFDPDDGFVPLSSYCWQQSEGPSVTLSDPSAKRPTFTAPGVSNEPVTLVFVLTVEDSDGATGTDTATITIQNSGNLPPVANAGEDQTVTGGTVVTLDGSGSSDPDDGIQAYAWQQTAGTGVTLSDASAQNPTFTAPTSPGGTTSLTFLLTVTDSDGATDTDTVMVTVENYNNPDNQPPTADAGDNRTVLENTVVTLDGSGSSDPDDGIRSYYWLQTAGTGVALSDASAQNPTFTAPVTANGAISLTFQLTVTDFGGATDTDTVTITVGDYDYYINQPPTADAGEDQTVAGGVLVTLDGSGSSDPDDGIQSYFWQQTAGTGVTLSDPSAEKPTFTTPAVSDYPIILTFKLTITDNTGATAEDFVNVTVTIFSKGSSSSSGGCFISEMMR